MLRRTPCLRYLITFRDITDRLDSFEKEVIDLKAFRHAVEEENPTVAEAARNALKKMSPVGVVSKAVLDNPLTAAEFMDLNQFYALQKPKDQCLENLLYIRSLNSLQEHAKVVQREYLVRAAHLAKILNNAPYGLSQMQGIRDLGGWYQLTFKDMRNTPAPTNREGALVFDQAVRRTFLRHYNVSSLLNAGMHELAEREQWDRVDKALVEAYPDVDAFFNEFCTKRVCLRFLVGNYMYLSTQILNIERDPQLDPEGRTIPLYFNHDPDSFVGQMCMKTSLLKVIECAVESCKKTFTDAEIEIQVAGDPDLTFVGIPYITYDIVYALLEDAVQANLEREELLGTPCSKIEITLAQRKGNESYTVRVSDTAGGLPLRAAKQALSCWSVFRDAHGHTMPSSEIKTWTHSPIRLPYGWRASHVIGGNVRLGSVEGYGTDRYFYIPARGVGHIVL